MPGNLGGIRRGYSRLPDPPYVLGSAAYGCKSREILHVGLPGLQGGDTWVPAILHYLQRGGGCGVASLG